MHVSVDDEKNNGKINNLKFSYSSQAFHILAYIFTLFKKVFFAFISVKF